jgi:hypothetical protein
MKKWERGKKAERKKSRFNRLFPFALERGDKRLVFRKDPKKSTTETGGALIVCLCQPYSPNVIPVGTTEHSTNNSISHLYQQTK